MVCVSQTGMMQSNNLWPIVAAGMFTIRGTDVFWNILPKQRDSMLQALQIGQNCGIFIIQIFA